mgnify:CR=1 FL=1
MLNHQDFIKKEFSTRVVGKWILAGEHTVLRGGKAVALPYDKSSLELRFKPNAHFEELKIYPIEAAEYVMTLIEKLRKEFSFELKLSGQLIIDNQIPIRSGLGSSAALCVSLVKWFSTLKNNFSEDELIKVAIKLEDLFHGKSSGLDVSVVFFEKPLLFSKEGYQFLPQLENKSNFRFHHTGEYSSTKDCIEDVNQFTEKNPKASKELDKQMATAVDIITQGLSEGLNKKKIVEGINLAQNCFESWQLVSSRAKKMIKKLKEDGALAVKMTGAGKGGYLVSFWDN